MNFLSRKSKISKYSKKYGLLITVPLIAAVCILSFFSCEVGLGASVDTAPPSNAITYPPKNAVVRDTFVIAGTCSDDTSVASVTVSIRNTGTNTSYGPFHADLAGNKKSWSIRLNKEKQDVPNRPYAGWDYPDGNYSVTAYATDASGRNSDVTASSFTIDNTPPILILTSPSSYGTTFTPDKSGRTISLTGNYAEDTGNKIAEMKACFFKKADGSKIGEITLTGIDHMAENNKYVIAKYSKNPTTEEDIKLLENYKTIFGEINFNNYTNNVPVNDELVYMTLLLSDGARVYNDPSNPAGSGPGNQTAQYYRNTDGIIDNFTKEGAAYPMSIFELKDFLNGKFTKYDEHVSDITTALNGATSAEYNATETTLADTTKATTLSINPKANPTFSVAGYEKAPPGSSAYNSNGFLYCTDGVPFNITISSGPDNVPIQYTGDKVTIYAVPADTDGNYSSSHPLPANWTTSTEPPSSLPAGWVKIANITGQSNKAAYTMTAKPVAPETSYGLSPNTLYRFAVWGRDINGIAIEDETGGPYVCVVKPTGNVPEIKNFKAEVNTSPAVNVGGKYVNKAMAGNTLTVTAKVSDGVSLGLTDAAIQANITAKAKRGVTDYTASDLTITKTPSSDKKSADVKFELTIPSDDTKDGKWTFTLSAKNKDGVSSDTQSIELTIDMTEPTWKTDGTPGKLPYIDPTQADNWYNTTALKVKAFAKDGGSGIDKLQYKLSNSSNWNDVGNGNFAFSCDSSLNGTLTVSALDKAGNKAEQVIRVKIDTVPPNTCALTGVDGGAAVDVKLINNTTTGVTFTFTASDVTGGSRLKSAEVVKIGNTVLSTAIASTESGGTYTASIPQASLADGAVTVRLTDNAGNTADFPLFTLVKDITPPTVKINTPSASATVNKTITVSGTAFDSREIADKVEVLIKTAASGASEWTKYNAEPPITDGIWTFTLDTNNTSVPTAGGIGTYDSDGTANGRQLTFKITAKDAAGNVGAEERTITVDQNADRPVIRFTNLSLTGMTATNPVWFKGADTIYGSITDDDGEVQSFKYFIGDNSPNDLDWTDIPISGGSWNLTLPDGPAKIWFKVTDAKAGEFISVTTASTNAPKLTDGTDTFGEGAHPDSKLYLKVDTHAPEMRNVQISRNGTDWSSDFEKVNGKDLLLGGKTDSGDPAKGGSEKFYIKFEAKDANGIDEGNLFVKVSNLWDNGTKVPEHTYTTAASGTGKTHINVTSGSTTADGWTLYTFDAIPCTTGSGTMQLDIVATDTAGNKFPISRNAKVDNTAPEVKFSSPTTETGSGISPTKGTTRVAGEIDDSTAKVWFAVSVSETVSPDSDTASNNMYKYSNVDGTQHDGTISSFDPDKTAYKDVKDISSRWYIMFDDDMDTAATGMHSWTLNKWLIHLGITTQNEIDGIPPAVRYEKITRLYVWIKATDAHGNTKEYKFPIWHDPQGDRPSVTIDYPANNAKLGGTVRLAGNATDNNNPTAVFVQILSGDAQIAAGAPTAAELTNLKNKGYDIRLMSGSGSGGAAWTGAPASGKTVADYGIVATLTGGSWSLPINGNGEFNPSGDTPNKVKITAYAYDASHNKSLPKSVNVTFDKNNPVFGSIQLVKSTNENLSTANSAQQTTASGATYSVKDTWYIYGSVTDADTIKKLTIKDSSTTHTLITGGTASSSSGLWNVTNTGNTATFKYKLDTASGVGECPIEIEAYDATTQEYNSKYTLTIKYDNKAPVLLMPSETGYNIKADISQSDSFYTFGSKVKEDAVGGKAQSGFKRLAFFFMRRIGGNFVYDPMLVKTDPKNKLTIGGNISYDSGLYWKEYSGVSWNSSTPELLTLSSKDENVHTGGLVQVNGAIYRIQSVTASGITLDTALAANPGATVKVALALVVDHLSAEGGVSSLEADGYYSPAHLINDDGDRMIESVSKSGTEWTWEASICSRNIPDGPIELHYVAFDEAGNYSVGVVGNVDYTTFQGYSTDDKSDPHLQVSAYAYDSAKPAFVSNNRPRIAGVTFGTDYNGNGTIDAGEKITAYRAPKTKSEYDADNGDNVPGIKSLTGFTGAGTAPSDKAVYDLSRMQYKYPSRKAVELATDLTLDLTADMTVRGYTEITPEIVGGNGAIYYQYNLPGIGEGVNKTAFISSGTTDYTIAEGTIALQLGDILKLSDPAESTKDLAFTFWDSTEGAAAITTAGWQTGRQKAALNVKMKFAGKTPATPTSKIQPFYWNSESDNSLYDNSKDNGHLEVESGLPAAFSSNTGVMDGDPKVSGQIVMRGSAHDDRFIEGLYISVPGMESVFTSAGLTVTKQVDSVTYYRIANNVSGTLTGTDKWSSNGFKFECPTAGQTIGKGGHDVNWTFSWDTSKITGVAKADVEVRVLAYNKGTPTCASASTGALSVDGTTHYAAATYDTPIGSAPDTTQTKDGALTNRYRMDVVPYITGLTTGLSKLGGTNAPDLYARTALGHYPVEDKETITVHGFNLAGAACTVGGVNSGNLTPVTGKVNVWKLTLSANAKSGELVATVNSISAINNKNNNDKPYNRRTKIANNDKLTDDVELDVWQFNSKAAQPHRGVITEPVMRINPSNGIIGFAFANGPDYFSMSKGTGNSYTKWHQNYDDFGNVDFVYDKAGTAHGVVAGRDINSSANHAGKFTYLTSKWGPASSLSDANNYGVKPGIQHNALRLEAIGQIGDMNGSGGNILDKTRIQHPSLAAAGSGSPRLYLAYYDSLNDQIRFKAGTLTSNYKADFGQFKDQETASAITPYNQANVGIVAGKYKNGSATTDSGNNPGTYLSLGVVEGSNAANDTAVLIWFDETSQKLKYTYKKNPQIANHASQSGNGNGTWSVPVDVFDKMNVGEYCKIAVDKNGGIHIAAFDSDAADLKYAYLSSYSDTSFKRSTVDSYGITGTYISLDVAYTENGANGKPVPYIGYYSASAGRSKLAYLVDTATGVSGSAEGTDDSGYFTGKWEISVVPTASRVQQDNINVGVWKTNTATDSGVIKASVTGNSNSDTNNGTVYGNGTANPVLGYAIKQSMNGYIETAQKK
ncbi:Ig-like domain-containing protein [Treponema denticola]|uniref:Ig-like domain-containing protein n=1 Tax=Treponema denticola TaxID=158 RepID=UPI002104907C|nr:Ig-like domain-containing protein [Treponema denticola]UTY25298.1 hypothetical protein E4N77_00390 [Treponema denticola]